MKKAVRFCFVLIPLMVISVLFLCGNALADTLMLPSGLKTIEQEAFSGDRRIETIILPEGLEEIGTRAFYGCGNMTGKLTIPASVQSIGASAFENCTNIKHVFVQADSASIGMNAFRGCDSLEHIYCTKNSDTWNNLTEAGYGDLLAAVYNVTSVIIEPDTLNMIVGQSLKLDATVLPAEAANRLVTWSSSDESIAVVSDDGSITAVSEGTAVITAVSQENVGLSASCRITVKRANIILSKTGVQLTVGEALMLTARISPDDVADLDFVWTSSNTACATVDGNGMVVAFAPGEADITVGIAGYDGYDKTCRVTVVEEISHIITGCIRGLGSRTGVEGVSLKIRNSDDMAVVSETMTDENGRYTLALKSGEYILYASRDGYVDFSRRLSVSDLFGEYDMLITEMVSTAGYIYDVESWMPIEGASVSFTDISNPDNSAETVSDENGMFSMILIPGRYSLTVSREGYAAYTGSTEIKYGGQDLSIALGEGHVWITGCIRDRQTNEVVHGVTVQLRNEDGNETVTSAQTDENGEFSLYAEPGYYILNATKDGYTTYAIKLTADYHMEDQSFCLARETVMICGYFYVQQTNDPLENVSVLLRTADDSHTVDSALTGEHGEFTFEAVPGEYILKAVKDGYTSYTADLTVDYDIGQQACYLGKELVCFSGHVSDRQTYEMVEGASILLRNEDNSETIASTETDEDGTFMLIVAPGEYILRVVKDDYITYSATLPVEYDIDGHDIALTRILVRISGNIRDRQTGNPVTGAEVLLRDEEDSLTVDSAVTGDNGEFILEAMPGRYILKAALASYNSYSGSLTVDYDMGNSEIILFGERVSITGSVSDKESYYRLAGATVELAYEQNGQTALSLSTNDDGEFAFSVAPGKYIFRITKEGYAGIEDRIEINYDSYGRDYLLAPGHQGIHPISGTVFSAQTGYTVSGATIVVRDEQDTEDVAEALTNEEGCYFLDIDPGRYIFRLMKDGYGTQEQVMTISSSVGEYNFTMPPFHSIGGCVQDRQTWSYLSGVQIKIQRADGNMLDVSLTTDEWGYYTADLVPGEYIIRAVKEDYLDYTENITVTYDQSNYDIRMCFMTVHVEGHVADRQYNSGADGAILHIRNKNGGSEEYDVAADENGYFEFDIPAGLYILSVSKDGYAEYSADLDVNYETEGLDIVLAKETVTVEGRVTDRQTGQAIPGAVMEVRNAAGDPLSEVTLDSDGYFRFEAPEGRYTFIISADGTELYSRVIPVDYDIELPQDIIVTKADVHVEGQIFDRQTGKGIKDEAMVEVLDRTGTLVKNVRAGQNGGFDFEIAEGRYTLRVSSENYNTYTESINIDYDIGYQKITLTKKFVTIEGCVTDTQSLSYVAGASVEVHSLADDSLIASTTTDYDGYFSVEAEPGRYRLRIVKADYYTYEALLKAEYEIKYQNISMAKEYVLVSGRIKDRRSGRNISGVTVEVRASEGIETIAETITDTEGYYELRLTPGIYVFRYSHESYAGIEQSLAVSYNNWSQNYTLSPSRITLEGTVTSSVTKTGIDGALVQILNAEEGYIVNNTHTDGEGRYSLMVDPGHYIIQVSKEGYVDENQEITIGWDTSVQNFILLTQITSEQYRIKLTWGMAPRDLDSHLCGYSASGNYYHVYFASKNFYSGEINICNLDVDDTTSYGPEYITLTPDTYRPYYYYVYNYSGEGSIPTSGAKITVYRGNTKIREFTAPEGGTERYWNVFAIVNDTLIVNNTLTSVPLTNYAESGEGNRFISFSEGSDFIGSGESVTSYKTNGDIVSRIQYPLSPSMELNIPFRTDLSAAKVTVKLRYWNENEQNYYTYCINDLEVADSTTRFSQAEGDSNGKTGILHLKLPARDQIRTGLYVLQMWSKDANENAVDARVKIRVRSDPWTGYAQESSVYTYPDDQSDLPNGSVDNTDPVQVLDEEYNRYQIRMILSKGGTAIRWVDKDKIKDTYKPWTGYIQDSRVDTYSDANSASPNGRITDTYPVQVNMVEGSRYRITVQSGTAPQAETWVDKNKVGTARNKGKFTNIELENGEICMLIGNPYRLRIVSTHAYDKVTVSMAGSIAATITAPPEYDEDAGYIYTADIYPPAVGGPAKIDVKGYVRETLYTTSSETFYAAEELSAAERPEFYYTVYQYNSNAWLKPDIMSPVAGRAQPNTEVKPYAVYPNKSKPEFYYASYSGTDGKPHDGFMEVVPTRILSVDFSGEESGLDILVPFSHRQGRWTSLQYVESAYVTVTATTPVIALYRHLGINNVGWIYQYMRSLQYDTVTIQNDGTTVYTFHDRIDAACADHDLYSFNNTVSNYLFISGDVRDTELVFDEASNAQKAKLIEYVKLDQASVSYDRPDWEVTVHRVCSNMTTEENTQRRTINRNTQQLNGCIATFYSTNNLLLFIETDGVNENLMAIDVASVYFSDSIFQNISKWKLEITKNGSDFKMTVSLKSGMDNPIFRPEQGRYSLICRYINDEGIAQYESIDTFEYKNESNFSRSFNLIAEKNMEILYGRAYNFIVLPIGFNANDLFGNYSYEYMFEEDTSYDENTYYRDLHLHMIKGENPLEDDELADYVVRRLCSHAIDKADAENLVLKLKSTNALYRNLYLESVMDYSYENMYRGKAFWEYLPFFEPAAAYHDNGSVVFMDYYYTNNNYGGIASGVTFFHESGHATAWGDSKNIDNDSTLYDYLVNDLKTILRPRIKNNNFSDSDAEIILDYLVSSKAPGKDEDKLLQDVNSSRAEQGITSKMSITDYIGLRVDLYNFIYNYYLSAGGISYLNALLISDVSSGLMNNKIYRVQQNGEDLKLPGHFGGSYWYNIFGNHTDKACAEAWAEWFACRIANNSTAEAANRHFYPQATAYMDRKAKDILKAYISKHTKIPSNKISIVESTGGFTYTN